VEGVGRRARARGLQGNLKEEMSETRHLVSYQNRFLAGKLKFTLKNAFLPGSGVIQCGVRNAERGMGRRGNGCVYWSELRFSWRKNGLPKPLEFPISIAEKGPTWGITKKLFSTPQKTCFFCRFLKSLKNAGFGQ